MNMQTTLEEVLKDDLMKGVVIEADKDSELPVKVFKTIGGLPNLGRTYFWKQDEIEDKRKWVEAQMV